MHEPVSTQYHQWDVCCHHVGHLHRYADHHHQCQLLCERRRMSTEVFTGGAFYSSWSFLFTQRKVLPPHRTPITQCDISGRQRTQIYKYSNVFTDIKTLFLVKNFYLEKIWKLCDIPLRPTLVPSLTRVSGKWDMSKAGFLEDIWYIK